MSSEAVVTVPPASAMSPTRFKFCEFNGNRPSNTGCVRKMAHFIFFTLLVFIRNYRTDLRAKSFSILSTKPGLSLRNQCLLPFSLIKVGAGSKSGIFLKVHGFIIISTVAFEPLITSKVLSTFSSGLIQQMV